VIARFLRSRSANTALIAIALTSPMLLPGIVHIVARWLAWS
jgi:hypothetical protein